MPEIQAFRGLRYDLGHVGALSDVVAPPYDVIDPALRDQLYQRHPANVIRLILNRPEPGDDAEHNPYQRAARFLRTWRSEGVLQQDPDAAVYVYHQEFVDAGQTHVRRGFMARLRLERFGEGRVFPHEQTHPAAKADRLRLTQACQTQLSPIFGLYPDADNRAQEVLEDAIRESAPLQATDHLDVVHRLWPVTDLGVIGEVSSLLSPLPLYVADGHHRYETACNYRDRLAASRSLAPNHPANFVLTMCVSMDDPGLRVLPTHRLFRLPPMATHELKAQLGNAFHTSPAGSGPDAATHIWQKLAATARQDTMALFATRDGQWLNAQLTPAGRQQWELLAAHMSRDLRQLGVSILHRFLLEKLLETPEDLQIDYVHQAEEVAKKLAQQDAGDEPYGLAALVMPASLSQIRAISGQGERMPPKSTYFYPKLLSGLVFHSLQ